MYYARWTTTKEMQQFLIKINLKKEVKKSGLPLMYDNNNLYINDREDHTLVIGTTGSGKTQVAILPLLKLSILAGESFVVNDIKGEIYRHTAKELESRGYNIIAIDFDNPDLGSSWNPLILAYSLYQEGNKDKALNLIEDLGYYLFTDPIEKTLDSFWINSTIDYFTGLTLYLFENGIKEEINLNSIYNISNELTKQQDIDNLLKKIDKTSTIYYNLSGTLNAPLETRGGILSTFNQKLKKYISSTKLSNMMLDNSFDIKNISNTKNAVFIISGLSSYANSLIPLCVSQIIASTDIYGKKEKNLNIILDDFDSMLPIRNFTKITRCAS